MASPFSRSMRALKSDGFGRFGVALVVLTLVLGAWVVWFVTARVSVYEVSRGARLEVHQDAHPLDARVAGRVVRSALEVGRAVKAGDVLVEIESDHKQLELAEEEAKIAALAPQVSALEREAAAVGLESGAEKEALTHARAGTKETLDEARARQREADAAVRYADTQLARIEMLAKGGHSAPAEVERARADALQRKAAAQALRSAVGRLDATDRVARGDRKTRIARLRRDHARLRRDLALLRGEAMARRATIARLRFDIEKHRVRAPASGRLGEVVVLRGGSVVKEGDRLATIVPSGDVKVVADFTPAGAIGRVSIGQSAHLRLDGFPWAQYGSIPATVSAVGGESRNGLVRVELTVAARGRSPIPLQHGLPGSVEVEIEKVSPATLVLRAAGKLLSGSAAASSETGAPMGAAPTPASGAR